jgi:hypothetical protein
VIPWGAFLSGVAWFASASPFSRIGFPLDDAWIHRVYSRAFAFGHGFQYNDGLQEAGSTSPLWAIVSAPAHWLDGFGPETVVIAVKVLGVLLTLLAIGTVQRIAEVAIRSRAAAILAATLFALEPRLIFAALSGMENPLLLTLCLGATYALVTQRWLLGFGILSLAPVTRPESLVLLPVFALGAWALMDDRESVLNRVRLWPLLGLPICLFGLFCKAVNGHWLPNTFYVKASGFALGAEQYSAAWELLSQHGFGALVILPLGVGVYLAFQLRSNDHVQRTLPLFLVMAPLAYLLAVVTTRQIRMDGYYWTRWADPASLALTVPFTIGYAIVLTAPRLFRRNRALAWTATALGLAGLALSAPSFGRSLAERRARLATDSRAVHLINVRAAEWIHENTAPDATIGVNNAGAIRYFGRRRTIDLAGLNYADIAFRRKHPTQVLHEIDWLVLFERFTEAPAIATAFEPRAAFSVPLEEYTICNCPDQTRQVVLERQR